MFKYSLNLEWSIEDESYIATIQEFPGLSAFGETPQEAVKEAITAAKGFLQIIKEDGDEIPEPIIKKKFSGQNAVFLEDMVECAACSNELPANFKGVCPRCMVMGYL